jgi:hypothetical protein
MCVPFGKCGLTAISSASESADLFLARTTSSRMIFLPRAGRVSLDHQWICLESVGDQRLPN